MVIAVDFDGTIVTHDYPRIDEPIPCAIHTLLKLQQEDHHQLILWTVREGDLLKEAVDYCASKGLEFYAVNSNYPEEDPASRVNRKVTADIYIDDRNLGGLPDWGIIYNMIHNGKQNQPVPTDSFIPDPALQKKSFFSKLFG